MINFKCHFIFLALLFVAFSCNKEVVNEPNQAPLQQAKVRSADYSFDKIPNYDMSRNVVDSMTYHINDGQNTYMRGYNIDFLLENLGENDYLWKIVEDAYYFEIEQFNNSRIGGVELAKIQDANNTIFEFDPNFNPDSLDCFPIPIGAIGSFEYFSSLLENDPWLLYGGEECVEDNPFYEEWRVLAEFYPSQEVIDSIKNNDVQNAITTLEYGRSGNVNLDYHAVEICDLPTYPDGSPFSPEDLLLHIRSIFYIDPFDSNCDKSFELYPEYDDVDWIVNPLGTIFEIELLPTESGDVVCSYFEGDSIVSQTNGLNWIFTTLYGKRSGYHPVSGNRRFGLKMKSNGCWEFYTMGTDRTTTWYHSMLSGTAFSAADEFWDCFIEQVKMAVNNLGGNAGTITSIHCRPNWEEIKESWKKHCYQPPTDDMIPPCTECL